MPRKTKDVNESIEETKITKKAFSTKEATKKEAKSIKKASSDKEATKKEAKSTKKTSSAKEAIKKEAKSTKKASSAKEASKKEAKSTKKASSAKEASKKEAKSIKKASSAKEATKKEAKSTKKTSSAKEATKKEAKSTKKASKKEAKSIKKASSVSKNKKVKNAISKITSQNFSAEYYDLPFKYNKTIVKILAQTPTNLFIYWEISDEDREKLKEQFGKYFFEITKPVLLITNETLNYAFEIDINDFANSWYLHVNDSNCSYKVELGRRPIEINYNFIPDYNYEKEGKLLPLQTPYIYISSSNKLTIPNDRILFNLENKIYFKNIKTNEIIEKDIKDFPAIYNSKEFISVYEMLKDLFKSKLFINDFDLNNPSSQNVGSGSFFKF